MEPTLFELTPQEFEGVIAELGLPQSEADQLRRQYRRQNSMFAGLYGLLDSVAGQDAEQGRVRADMLPMTRPEGMTGIEALLSGNAELAIPGGLLGGAEAAVMGIDAPAAAYQGMIPAEDMAGEALGTAGMAMAGGGAAAARPAGSVGMGGRVAPTLQDAYAARAEQMALPPVQRVQPNAERPRFVDSDYLTPPGQTIFSDDLAEFYPRNPNPEARLPFGDRGRELVNRREDIAQALADRIEASGVGGTNVQYFYHSDGPLYRAAIEAGLSPDEAALYLRDFSNFYAATSPRTNTTQNLLNATSVMAKEASGVPFRTLLGPGSGGINESGYPMMIGPSGIHGLLLDDVLQRGRINTSTNPKPATFGGNMAGNRSGATMDTHAIRGTLMTLNDMDPGSVPLAYIAPSHRDAYVADPSVLTPDMILDTLGSQKIGGQSMQTEYPIFADIWHSAADRLNVSPAEAQSMGWFGMGDRTNLGSAHSTVAELFDERLDVTARNLGISTEEAARLVFGRQIPLMANASPELGLLAASAPSEEDQLDQLRAYLGLLNQ